MKKKIKNKFNDPEIEASLQEFRQGVEGLEEDLENEEKFPYDMNTVDQHITVLEDLCKDRATSELKEELRVYKAYRRGHNIGWQIAVEYLSREVDDLHQPQEEPEIIHPKEENAYKHDPNYEFKPLTYEEIDRYDAIAYGPFLGIPWEEFNKMIKRYCKDRKRKGKWKTNEWGTQTFYFLK